MAAKKIFATNHDIGGSQAIAPVLSRLASEGHNIIVCGLPNSPGFPILRGLSAAKICELTDDGNLDHLIRELLEKEQPDVVLVGWSGAPNTTDKLSITAANNLRIPTVLVGDTWPYPGLSDLSVHDDSAISLYRTLSKVCVVDDIAKNIFVETGFDPMKVVATGNPALDNLAKMKIELPKYRAEMRKKFGLHSDAMIIYYAVTCELEDEEINGPGYGLLPEKIVLEEFLSAVNETKKNPDLRLEVIVRQKPSYRTEMIRKLIAEKCPSAIFDNERFFDGLAPVVAADIVIGTYTTVLEKAALLGIPAISYVPTRNSDNDPMVTNKYNITIPFYSAEKLDVFFFSIMFAPEFLLKKLKESMRPANLASDATGNVAREILALCDK